MASLDFPTNPTDQQQYTLNGIVYYYNAADIKYANSQPEIPAMIPPV